MTFSQKRERDQNGRFVIPTISSVFDVKEYRRLRYQKDKLKILTKNKEWAKRNPEKRAEIRKRWKARNRPLVNYYQKLRFYREKNSIGSHSLKDIEYAKKIWSGKCAYCEIRIGSTMDHVNPLTKGGTNYSTNLVPACFSCNSSKGNKSIWEWDFWWAYKYSRIRV